MRIGVIGAGIAGITTAAELARLGHEVHVYERRDGIAEEASFASGGLISPALVHCADMPLLRPCPEEASGVEAGAKLQGGMSARWKARPWIKRWIDSARAPDTRARRNTLTTLARLSQWRLQQWTHDLSSPMERHQGLLVLLRQPQQLEPARQQASALQALGLPAKILEPQACHAIEPALGGEHEWPPEHIAGLSAALHLPGEEVGNCRRFAQQLLEHGEAAHGVQLHLGVQALKVTPAQDHTPVLLELGRGLGGVDHAHRSPHTPGFADTEILPQRWTESLDAVVICSSQSVEDLLAPLGLTLPLLPIWGHTVTYRLHPHATPIRSAVVDPMAGVILSRQGDRLRACGGFDLEPPAIIDGRRQPSDASLAPLYAAVDRWYPNAVMRDQVQVWSAPRPMLPDGLPALGASGQPGVWVNTAHGGMGWTLACGSALLLTQWLTQSPRPQPADFDPAHLAPTRWQRP